MTAASRRLLAVVPPGTLAVGSGLAVLGVAAYTHLAVAGHTLDDGAMSSLAVLWSLVYAVGFGLFFPIEQEITRLVAAGSGRAKPWVGGDGVGAVGRRGGLLAAGILGVLLLLVVAAGPWLTAHLFGGDAALGWAFAGALTALAVTHTARGVLAGRSRFAAYGTQLGIDGALRIVLAAGLGLAAVDSAFWFAAILTIAPLASVALTLPALRGEGGRGRPVPWRDLVRGLGLLVVSALAAQLVVNIAVVDVRLLDPGETQLAAAMLAAVVLVRVPLFVFASLQASLLPGLTAAAGPEFARLLRHALLLVTALGVIGGLVGVTAGPALAVALFDAPAVLGAADFAWLSLGTLAYLWALVLGTGVLALGRHRDTAVAWVAGAAVLAGVTLLPGAAVTTRVELGYALASFTVAALLGLLLSARSPRARTRLRGWRSFPAHKSTIDARELSVGGRR